MKREELTALQLTEEQVEAVMRLHGQGLTELQNRLEKQNQELAAARQQTQVLQKQLEAGDPAELARQLQNARDEAQSLKDGYEQQLKDKDMHYAIRSAMPDAQDAEIVASLLDVSRIKLEEDGSLTGLAEQLAALRETKPFLFESSHRRPMGIRPAESDGYAGAFTKEQIAGMTPQQINANWDAVSLALQANT